MREIKELTNQELFDITKRHLHAYNPFIKGLQGGLLQANRDVGELLMEVKILKEQVAQLRKDNNY